MECMECVDYHAQCVEVGRSETAANPIIISLIVNWSTLILHSEQAAAGGGGTVNSVDILNGKGFLK